MGANINNLNNPLATDNVGKLIFKFATPSIISFLVSALYNIVDQIFIGQGVGMLGNAATNIAFPLNTICTALALLLGIGGASNFNLRMGQKKEEEAAYIVGNSVISMVISGVTLSLLVIIFLNPLLHLFGATKDIMPYALTYTRITAFGIPFLIFSIGCSNLIRSDGSPTYAMLSTLSGAILNTILDPIFIFVFDLGMAGAAYATVIGQILSSIIVARYLFKFKSVKLSRNNFKLRKKLVLAISALGAAACFNQLAMMVVQITMNNILTYYGALSHYGSEIPLASVGVISKVNIVYLAFTLGISQGCQPIVGFNYGAQNYDRVKKTYKTAAIAVTLISIVAFLCFQIFPRQIISIFGQGNENYFEFAQRYFRIFMFMTFVNGIQPLTSNFFTSIGKSQKGIILSLTRQIIFLLPLVIILPKFLGIDGVMYAGPIADSIAFITAGILIYKEIRCMNIKMSEIDSCN